MTSYDVSRRARADMREIWNYSAERWGNDQANRYIRLLHQAMETIARDPRRGRSYDHVRVGYRKYAVGSHVLFFRMVEGRAYIVRILHQSMDFDRHL